MKYENNDANEKMAWGLILGFMGEVLLDQLAFGLIIGVLLGVC